MLKWTKLKNEREATPIENVRGEAGTSQTPTSLSSSTASEESARRLHEPPNGLQPAWVRPVPVGHHYWPITEPRIRIINRLHMLTIYNKFYLTYNYDQTGHSTVNAIHRQSNNIPSSSLVFRVYKDKVPTPISQNLYDVDTLMNFKDGTIAIQDDSPILFRTVRTNYDLKWRVKAELGDSSNVETIPLGEVTATELSCRCNFPICCVCDKSLTVRMYKTFRNMNFRIEPQGRWSGQGHCLWNSCCMRQFRITRLDNSSQIGTITLGERDRVNVVFQDVYADKRYSPYKAMLLAASVAVFDLYFAPDLWHRFTPPRIGEKGKTCMLNWILSFIFLFAIAFIKIIVTIFFSHGLRHVTLHT